MFKIYKIFWHLREGITPEKADLPQHYKVPFDQKTWSKKRIKQFLTKKYHYKIKKIEEL